ncbi:MAG TPA: fibronectin type III domain-containing protein, partial [Solirubrobacterales bacterium]
SDFQANGFSNALSLSCPENPDGTTNTSLSAKVSGLTPGGAYRFRVTATSNAGTTSSNDKTFEALQAVPPTVSTDPAQSVTQIEAKLKGTANPHGGTASDCHFELGTTASYGSNYACALPGPVTSAVAESKSVSGLKPSTTYHYRLVVSTNAGTAKGGDVTFTTADPPPVESDPEPDPIPPPATTPPPPTDPGPTTHLPQCKKGFRRERIHGQPRCVKVCRTGFRQVRVRAKVKCVRRKHSNRRRHTPAER